MTTAETCFNRVVARTSRIPYEGPPRPRFVGIVGSA